MYCSRTLTPSGGRAEQLRGGALGAMPTTKKVLTRAEAKAMALRDGVEQVVLTHHLPRLPPRPSSVLARPPPCVRRCAARPHI